MNEMKTFALIAKHLVGTGFGMSCTGIAWTKEYEHIPTSEMDTLVNKVNAVAMNASHTDLGAMALYGGLGIASFILRSKAGKVLEDIYFNDPLHSAPYNIFDAENDGARDKKQMESYNPVVRNIAGVTNGMISSIASTLGRIYDVLSGEKVSRTLTKSQEIANSGNKLSYYVGESIGYTMQVIALDAILM